ncbi:protein disulfide-isomerase precursor [Allomyces javanicus]|nr:protein disulfide-isomerase precursor [Allomyces javanicus]
MKLLNVACLALAILAASVTADASKDDSHVLTLTKDTFHKTVNDADLMLVEFYAPWCGHCQKLAPEYEKAATELVKEKIHLGKVDCTTESEVCEGLKVMGYPTMKVFRQGKDSPYAGGRQSDEIVRYMRKQSLPALSKLAVEEIIPFSQKDKVVVIGHAPTDDHAVAKVLQTVAEELRDDYMFGITADRTATGILGIDGPGLVIYKTFDDPHVIYDGKIEADAVKEFVKTQAVPVMADIVPENYMEYANAGKPLTFFFYENEEQKKAIGSQIEKVAREFKGKINFVYCDANKFGAHADTLNLKQEWPALAISEVDKGLKWPFDQSKDLTEAAVREFVVKYSQGELPPSLKSAEEPEGNDEAKVVTIVGNSFDKRVMDPTKDVFVEFYAPWCGHCKRLAPTWDQLGEFFADKPDVIIAKMDATENDVPPATPFRIEGFPTLKLFRAKDNVIVDYDGDRTFEDLVQFVKTHAVNNDFVVESTADKKDEDAAQDEAEAETPKADEAEKKDEAKKEAKKEEKKEAPVAAETPAAAADKKTDEPAREEL